MHGDKTKIDSIIDTIICGDCLEVMADWPGGCVDDGMIITDPPYNVGKKYAKWNDSLPEDKYIDFYKKTFTELFRVLRRGYLYVTCTTRQKYIVKPFLEDIGWEFVQDLVWFRPNFCGGTRLIELPWSTMHEPALMFKKGKRLKMLNEVRGVNTYDVFTYPSPQRNWKKETRQHICQKPLGLYVHWISRTPGNFILDPFCGSGTTCVAAKMLGRHYIGIDISEEYCETARKKIEAAEKGITVKELEQGQQTLFDIKL